MKKLLLTGTEWKLIYVKNETLKKDGAFTTVQNLKDRGYPEIKATVPGNLEIDLENAGVIEDPFYAGNHRKRDCEFLHMFYYRSFVYDGSLEAPALVFEGLDTVAEVYLNGALIGNPENMLIPHTLRTDDVLRLGENELCVHIIPAVIAARKYTHALTAEAFKYNAESLYIRKAPHMYAWDIMPRMVSGGIWRPVYLAEHKADRIKDCYIYTRSVDLSKNTAKLYFHFNTEISRDEIADYTVSVKGSCGDSEFEISFSPFHTSGSRTIHVDNARFWWPKHNGEANLYDTEITLFYKGEALDVYKTRIGIRTVELIRTSVTDKDGNGDFHFEVNGKPIFCMGTNWVPVDALHSRDASRLPKILPMLNDLKCNIIRIWGGNVYEDDILYDFCDENGILVWQDFIMGCATYPQDTKFQKKLYDEVCVTVKRLRQHPSIALWSGDNEDDCAYENCWGGAAKRDPNKNILTRSVIPQAIWEHDYVRPFLPSSPYIDEVAFKSGLSCSEGHPWGPRDYFKGEFYSNVPYHFASEIGYHGCTSPESIKKFIPEEYLWTSENNENWEGINNTMWLAHAASLENVPETYTYRIKLMSGHVTTLFGKTVPNTLDDFARASQISQAEAKKYFIERFRIRKPKTMGIIWWNLIDGWPQFSDAVVDYYGVKKLAYSYIKRSQESIALMFDEPKNGVLPLHAVSEYDTDKALTYKVTDITANKVVSEGEALAKAKASAVIASIPVQSDEKHFYFIEWELDGKKQTNHFMTNIKDIDYKEYLGYIEKCGYGTFEGFL